MPPGRNLPWVTSGDHDDDGDDDDGGDDDDDGDHGVAVES